MSVNLGITGTLAQLGRDGGTLTSLSATVAKTSADVGRARMVLTDARAGLDVLREGGLARDRRVREALTTAARDIDRGLAILGNGAPQFELQQAGGSLMALRNAGWELVESAKAMGDSPMTVLREVVASGDVTTAHRLAFEALDTAIDGGSGRLTTAIERLDRDGIELALPDVLRDVLRTEVDSSGGPRAYLQNLVRGGDAVPDDFDMRQLRILISDDSFGVGSRVNVADSALMSDPARLVRAVAADLEHTPASALAEAMSIVDGRPARMLEPDTGARLQTLLTDLVPEQSTPMHRIFNDEFSADANAPLAERLNVVGRMRVAAGIVDPEIARNPLGVLEGVAGSQADLDGRLLLDLATEFAGSPAALTGKVGAESVDELVQALGHAAVGKSPHSVARANAQDLLLQLDIGTRVNRFIPGSMAEAAAWSRLPASIQGSAGDARLAVANIAAAHYSGDSAARVAAAHGEALVAASRAIDAPQTARIETLVEELADGTDSGMGGVLAGRLVELGDQVARSTRG